MSDDEMVKLRTILADGCFAGYVTAADAATLDEWVSTLRRKAATWKRAAKAAREEAASLHGVVREQRRWLDLSARVVEAARALDLAGVGGAARALREALAAYDAAAKGEA